MPGVYRRHRPESTALYEVVRDNLETLCGAIDDGAVAVRVPQHAWKELEAYFDCGRLCRGFARLRCGGLARDGALLARLTRLSVDTVQGFYAGRAAQEGTLGAKTCAFEPGGNPSIAFDWTGGFVIVWQSGFCRWIEELARRGVVGGCGGGVYCPTPR